MFLYALSFLAGTSQLLWLPQLQIIGLYISLLIVFVCLVYAIYSKNTRPFLSYFIVFLIGFSYAFVVAQSHKAHQLQVIPTQLVTVTGRVWELPDVTPKKTKFLLIVDNLEEDFPIRKLLLNWYETHNTIKPGQVWQFKLKMKPIHALYNPGSFDYSKWLFRQGIDAIATVKEGVLLEKFDNSLYSWVNAIRIKIAGVIKKHTDSPRVVSLLTALIIGDKSLISYEDSQLFQNTGTAHLIAISGLHIGLIAFIGLLIGRLFFSVFATQQCNRFVFEAIFSIGLALVYAVLAGFSIPTIRALVMVIVFALSYAFKSQIARWQAWSIALLVILVFDPLSVLDAGYWFSFSAVAVLMFAYSGKMFEKNKFLGFIKAQFIILIGLMPLMVVVFHQFNLLTPIANFLVLPLASLLLIPLLFLALFASLFSYSVAHFLFFAVEKTAHLFFLILDYLSEFSYLKITMPSYNPVYILVLVLMVIVLLLPRLFRWRPVVVILVAPLFFSASNGLGLGAFKIHVLDVGQGLSILVQTKNHSLVYDTGARYESGFSMAKAVVLPLMQSYGINKLDTLILSHADNDHAGGADEIIAKFNPKVFDVMGQFQACQSPLSWQWNEVSFEVLSPLELLPYMGNNTSCVLKISSDKASVLLTADIEEPVEYRLLSLFPKKIISDVLIVPHHGSKTSSSQDFLTQVSPQYAINSSGYANQFRHPNKIIKARYLDNQVRFYDTQSDGMLSVVVAKNSVKVTSYLNENPHFWHVEKLLILTQ